ncbi:MAG: BMP family ABC transporter substrate-binding protein, partial [Mesorhizobium sp.]
STAALQVAEERKLHGFGQSSDMIKFAPNAQLTSLTDEWGPYYISRVQAAIDGTWKPDNVWLGIKDGAVKLAPFTNMPDDVKAMAEATTKKIADGWNPFTGPIAKQDGSPWLKDGEVADDGT